MTCGAPASAAGERGARTDSEEEGRWAVGRKLAWAGVLPRSLSSSSFFPIRFLFCFSFVVFAKQTKNGLKQLLKLANCFPSVC
jgi:hypothetical protein